jgi:hypothetical protein
MNKNGHMVENCTREIELTTAWNTFRIFWPLPVESSWCRRRRRRWFLLISLWLVWWLCRLSKCLVPYKLDLLGSKSLLVCCISASILALAFTNKAMTTRYDNTHLLKEAVTVSRKVLLHSEHIIASILTSLQFTSAQKKFDKFKGMMWQRKQRIPHFCKETWFVLICGLLWGRTVAEVRACERTL